MTKLERRRRPRLLQGRFTQYVHSYNANIASNNITCITERKIMGKAT